jgi:hypothetical protein
MRLTPPDALRRDVGSGAAAHGEPRAGHTVMAGRGNPLDPSAAFGGSAIPTVAGIGRGTVTSDINVTPMVDVMLVLLIIFMVITPVLASYEAALPEAHNVVPEPDDDVVTLGIDAQGTFHLGGNAVAPHQLPAARSAASTRSAPATTCCSCVPTVPSATTWCSAPSMPHALRASAPSAPSPSPSSWTGGSAWPSPPAAARAARPGRST